MKNELTLLVLITVLLAVALVSTAWHLGKQNGRLAATHEANSEGLALVQSRLLPLEDDYERRKAARGRFAAVIGWLRGKLGL